LTLPLLVEFQKNIAGHKAYISVGGQAGFLLGTKTKVEYGNTLSESHSNKNVTPITYGLTARVGYRYLNLYANYSMSTLFEKDKGPELNPFSIGIMLVNF